MPFNELITSKGVRKLHSMFRKPGNNFLQALSNHLVRNQPLDKERVNF